MHQPDRHYGAAALQWVPTLSTHRPLSFARSTPGGRQSSPAPIPTWVAKEDDFAFRVRLEYQQKLIEYKHNALALDHLLILKASIKQVSLSIMQDKSRESTVSPEDRLGITVACIRAVEEVNVNKVVNCCRKYLELRGLINPEDPDIRSSASYTALKDHAVQFARADVQDDVEDLLHGDRDDDQAYLQKKEHVLEKLRRLCPGESKSLTAVRTQNGSITTDPSDMAQALVSHWSQVFAAKDSNQTLLRQWLDHLFGSCREGRYNTGLPDARAPGWEVRREHVKCAITYARSTMPGPDSIPAALWKALGDLSDRA